MATTTLRNESLTRAIKGGRARRSPTPMWLLLLSLFPVALSRGRYEFIDDADLPAFYSLRSAQLAQQAAALQQNPQAASVAGQPVYSPYYPYQVYQPAEAQPQPAVIASAPTVQYSPYLQYSQHLYRPQQAVSQTHAQPRMFYSPLAAYYGQSLSQSATAAQLAAKTKKKAA